ncbi:MAG: hypothetical protein K8S16_06630 [Bacteroidales bacterium]|nr:hypothetical protein [Bacteroidales bacterium]
MPDLITLNQGIENIKQIIEDSILESGEKGKKSAINSSKTINSLHDVIKSSLIEYGIDTNLIYPALGQTKPEIKLAGFLKFKKQDVCIFPNNLNNVNENLEFKGLHNGLKDPYGELFTEHVLTINVRSQLSSIAKNIDTMFERTFAEPINLHRRLPKMVLGEVYLIALRELDSDAVKQYNVVYKEITEKSKKALERYINGFSALNMRSSQRDDDFKYERVAFIIADFSQNPVKIYNTTEELVEDNLLPERSTASINNLNYDGFIEHLLDVYERRFGTGILS